MSKINYKNYPNQQPTKFSLLRAIKRWLTSSSKTVVIHNKNAVQDKHTIAVLFIHGTFDREGSFSVMTAKLKDSLPESISSLHRLSFKQRLRFLSISEYAKQVIDYVEANKLTNIILIGHSRGGNIAAYTDFLIKKMQKNINVHAVIAIASPLLGANIASLPFAWGSLMEMKPNSQFLTELNRSLDADDHKYYYVGAENDAIVSPRSACRNYRSQHHVVLRGEDHLSLPASPALIQYVQEVLQDVSTRDTRD